MPRELLLPIPHAIADKVHHTLQAAAETWAEEGLRENNATACAISSQMKLLADKLDTLAREAGVLGW
jgi:hypothetical protein